MNKFYKRSWKLPNVEECKSWGNSFIYIETKEDGIPLRQIQVFSNGNRLKYHSTRPFDEYGSLLVEALNPTEFEEFEITPIEFEEEWKKSNPKKEHQLILDMISEYLSNNYSLRFGQALFNLKVFEFSESSGSENHAMRDIHGDSDECIIERVEGQIKKFEKKGF